jgi:hypothetical protein
VAPQKLDAMIAELGGGGVPTLALPRQILGARLKQILSTEGSSAAAHQTRNQPQLAAG